MTVIEACNLSKDFQGEQAVCQLSLRAHQREVLGLVGPNGAGKTTTMLMLVGLLAPDSGEVRLFERPFSSREVEPRMQIGWVPQNLAFYPGLTVRENIQFFGSLYGLPDDKLRSREAEILEICGLDPFADQSGHTLSGGIQRRLNLALGLVHEPPVLVLDEPTVGIDSESRSLILRHIKALSEGGCTVLLASHYVDEVLATCDRVAVLNRGRLLSCEAVSDLSHRVSNEIQIVIKQPRKETVDRLREIPECSLREFGSRFKLTISAEHRSETAECIRALGEVLAVLKNDEVEILSLTSTQPTLAQLVEGGLSGAVESRSVEEAGAESMPQYSGLAGRLYRFRWAGLALLGALAVFLLLREAVTLLEPSLSESQLSSQAVMGSRASPDRATLAFQREGSIWIQSQDRSEPRRLEGTEGALSTFFWSFDSRYLAFVKEGKMWKVSVSDAGYSVICELPDGIFGGGSWGPGGTITFSMGSGVFYQVPADGGDPQLLWKR